MILYSGKDSPDHTEIFGNRIVTAVGKITAKTIHVVSGNGIGAILGDYDTVPIKATMSATFGTETFVHPAIAEGCGNPRGGVIFKAPPINGFDEVKLDHNADPERRRSSPLKQASRYIVEASRR